MIINKKPGVDHKQLIILALPIKREVKDEKAN